MMRALAVALALALTPPASGAPTAEAAATEEFLAYAEWVFDVSLTASERRRGAELANKARAAKSLADRELIADAVAAQRDLVNHSDADRKALRASVQDEYLKMLKKSRASLGRWLVGLKESATTPIASGEPPLTRHSADAYAELIALLVKDAQAVPEAAYLDAFAKALAEDYAGYSVEQKAALAQMPKTWTALRLSWGAFPEARKLKARSQWHELLKLQPGESPQLAPNAAAFRRAAQALATQVASWL